MDLANCIPKGKFDTEAVERAAEFGFPAINPILPELLEWVKDANWPAAQDLFPVLADSGPEITPHITAILESNDQCWKYIVLLCLVTKLKLEVSELYQENVVRMAYDPTEDEQNEEIDEQAREVMVQLGWPAP